MRDIALEPNTNTFAWERKDLTLTNNRLAYMQQKVRAALSLFKGEWFFDTRLGIPYIADIDTDKTTHKAVLESAIRAKAAGLDGVEKVTEFSTRLDKKTRVLYVSFTAKLTGGETLEVKDAVVGGVQ